nr:hypothetical protein [uncultured Albidiferax sp.]
MLQITTGRFFKNGVGENNLLRGILFTNVQIGHQEEGEIRSEVFGRLSQTSTLHPFPQAVIYEFTERIEGPSRVVGSIASHGADSYLEDMAVLFGFFFRGICSPDIDLVRRLISGQRGVATGGAPSQFVARVFDREIWCQPSEKAEFLAFVEHLIRLPRKTYLGAMRAIRTYVAGQHRMADDLQVAYTLLVAACESLTQDFDGHVSTWESVAEHKRLPMDAALEGVPTDVATRVRNAFLTSEHSALSRRFRDFATENVLPEYFFGTFADGAHPPGRSELPELLTAAYGLRSKYVHNLRQLPDALTTGRSYNETTIVGRTKVLTLQGLARLTRHVIMTFVGKQQTVDSEEYPYHSERFGIIQARWAGRYWVGRVDGDISRYGRDHLEGFLDELVGVLTKSSGAVLPDVTDMLRLFTAQAAGMRRAQRRPFFTLLILFNVFAPRSAVKSTRALDTLMRKDFLEPCAEALVTALVRNPYANWSLDEHTSALKKYRASRESLSGLRVPRLFEAALGLFLADRYRQAGNLDGCKAVLRMTAEEAPEIAVLHSLAESVMAEEPIYWPQILLPPLSVKLTDAERGGKRRRVRWVSPNKVGHARRLSS